MKKLFHPNLILMRIILFFFLCTVQVYGQNVCNLVQNGDFAIAGASNFIIAPNASRFNPEWFGTDATPGGGTNILIVDGPDTNQNVWSQNVQVNANTAYNFSALILDLTRGVYTTPRVSLTAIQNGVTTTIVDFTAATANWQTINGLFTPTTTGTLTLNVVIQGGDLLGNDLGVDDIAFTFTPPNNVRDTTLCRAGTVALEQSPNAAFTYQWFEDAAGTIPVTTLTPFVNASRSYWLRVQPNCQNALIEKRITIVSSITGLTAAYANQNAAFTVTVTNPNTTALSGRLTPTFAGFTPNEGTPTFIDFTIPARSSQTFTFNGFFASPGTFTNSFMVTGDCPSTSSITTRVFAGCPFALSTVNIDITQPVFPMNTPVMVLNGHSSFFDVEKIDFSFTYNPTHLEITTANLQLGTNTPEGSTLSSTLSNPVILNPDGTRTITGSVLYSKKIDILSTNSDGDPVITDIIRIGFKVLNRPAGVCEMQIPSGLTTFHRAGLAPISSPTDFGRISFINGECVLSSAAFTIQAGVPLSSVTQVNQGTPVTFVANPTSGTHTWYVGEFNNRQLGGPSATFSSPSYTYTVPGTYTVTHLRTINGVTNTAQQIITVCGITTKDIFNPATCPGSSVSIPFSISSCSSFGASNVFTAQLSDANGSFATPITIGTLAGTSAGTISAMMPVTLASGTGYRIRVVSSSPALIGTLSNNFISISTCEALAKALHFDGQNDWVDVKPTKGLTQFPITMEAMIKPELRSEGNVFYPNNVISNDIPSLHGLGFGANVYAGGSKIVVQYENGFREIATNLIANQWVHIAVVYTATTIQTYVNGNLIDTFSYLSQPLNGSTHLYIGKHNNDINYATRRFFKGAIDEVRIWNKALTSGEILLSRNCEINGNDSGLLLNYDFNIGLANANNLGRTTVTDKTANALHGILSDFALSGSTSNWISPGSVNSQCISYTLNFDGIDDRLVVPHHTAYNIGSSNYTVEALINIPTGTTGNKPIVSKRTSATTGFLFLTTGTRLYMQMNGVPNYISNLFPSIYDGKCHHVAVTRSGSTLTFYLDGIAVGTTSSTRSINSTGALHIGYDLVDNNSIKGTVSQVRMWNIARTAIEINTNKFATLSGNISGLIGYWQMNNEGRQVLLDRSSLANHGSLGTNNISPDNQDPSTGTLSCVSSSSNSSRTFASEIESSFHIYPNPITTGNILHFGHKVAQYTLRNGLGSIVAEGKNADQLPIRQLPKGMYLLQLDGAVEKVIIQ